MRSQLIQLLADYRARIKLVYVETGWGELLRRNRSRERPVPEDVIGRLANRLDVPNLTEAHFAECHVT